MFGIMANVRHHGERVKPRNRKNRAISLRDPGRSDEVMTMFRPMLGFAMLVVTTATAPAQQMPTPINADDVKWATAPNLLPAGAQPEQAPMAQKPIFMLDPQDTSNEIIPAEKPLIHPNPQRKFAQTRVLLCYYSNRSYTLGATICVGNRLSECKLTPASPNTATWIDVGRC